VATTECVEDVDVYVLEVPLERAYWMATEAYTTATEIFLILKTAGGLTGYGVAHGNPVSAIASVLTQTLIPAVLGADIWTASDVWDRMFATTYAISTESVAGQPHFGARRRFETMAGIAALDIALWDVRAKAVGLPLYRFLGSDVSAIPTYASGGYYPSSDQNELGIDELVDEVGSYINQGFSVVKVKAGRDVAGDIQRIGAVRKTFPDVGILVDANGGWSLRSAIRAGQELSRFNIGWLEEPLRWYYVEDDLATVASSTGVPVAAGEQEMHRWACARLVNHGRIRHMQFDCTRAGGITEWLEVATYAAIRGVGLAPHHDPQIHGHLLARYDDGMCESFPNAKRDPIWADFYDERPQISAGMLHLTDAPGLGVELNPRFLQRYGTKANT